MIIDAHTHVYPVFPSADAPDAIQRGSPDRLLATMDAHGVAKALLVGAIFTGGDSNALTIQSEHENPTRFVAFPQLDSSGTPTHHTAGAADRLAELHERHGGLRGFAHYCRDYDWFDSSDGQALFARALKLRHVVSIAVFAPGLPAIARSAERFPELTFLVHHLGRLQEKTDAQPDLAALMSVVRHANVWFKVSGFHHLSSEPRAFPHTALQPLVRLLYNEVGARRLVWGSDAPVVEQHMSYRQSLDLVRAHTSYMSDSDRALVLGGNLARLFAWN